MTNLYRSGVGAVLINRDNLIFVAKRIDTPDDWQMPQGGIEENEDPQKAILRELKEETGTNNATIIGRTSLLKYNLPPKLACKVWNGKYRGQQQIWFFLRFNGYDDEINLNYSKCPEFKSWKWVNSSDVLNLIINFKKEMYKEIISEAKKQNIF